MDHQQFIALVAEMREAQRGFFAAKRNNDRQEATRCLKVSIQLEEQVDKQIASFQSGQIALDIS